MTFGAWQGGTPALERLHQVLERESRMGQEHSGTRIPHHLTHLLSHTGGIAMCGAPATRRFVLPIRTMLKPLERVIEHGLAFGAQGAGRMMVTATIDLEHELDRTFFTIQKSLVNRHGFPLGAIVIPNYMDASHAVEGVARDWKIGSSFAASKPTVNRRKFSLGGSRSVSVFGSLATT